MNFLTAELGEFAPLLGNASGWVLVVIALVTLIKIWPRLKELQLESDNSLRNDLLKRVASLEAELKTERESCALQLAAMQLQIDGMRRQHILTQIAWLRALPDQDKSAHITHVLEVLELELQGFRLSTQQEENSVKGT